MSALIRVVLTPLLEEVLMKNLGRGIQTLIARVLLLALVLNTFISLPLVDAPAQAPGRPIIIGFDQPTGHTSPCGEFGFGLIVRAILQ